MVSESTDLPEWLKEIYPFSPKRFIAPSGGTMSYLDEGAGDEAVVMVHGNPTWSFFYRKVVLALRGKIRCIVPDHIGCGLSDKPQRWDYTLPNHIANLRSLLNSLKLRRIHLIVHDWGGPVGLGAMLPYAEPLGNVVILNTAAFADTIVPSRIRLCRTPVVGELLVRGANGFAWPATWMAVKKPLTKTVKAGFLYPYNSWANRIATHRFVVDIPSGQGTPSDAALAGIESLLPQLKSKSVRIIWGGQDFCFNRYYFDRWVKLVPKARADYLPEAGHYLMEDDPEFTIAAIEQHILDRAVN